MPNPKRKHTPSRRDSRRSANSKLTATAVTKCPQCSSARQPHHVCPSCGFYNGEVVIQKKKAENTTEEGK